MKLLAEYLSKKATTKQPLMSLTPDVIFLLTKDTRWRQGGHDAKSNANTLKTYKRNQS